MKYDRRILVPYLKSAMEAEMVCEILKSRKRMCSNEISGLKSDINGLRRNEEVFQAKVEHGENIKMILTGLASIVLIPVLVFVLCAFIELADSVLGIFGISFWESSWSWNITKVSFGLAIVICIGSIIIAISEVRDVSKANKMRIYKHSIETQKRNISANNKSKNLTLLEDKSRLINSLYEQACQKRKEIYSANIIAEQYRDVYSVTYLYRYFNTSREDDLDKIIQTLLLDNIQRTLKEIKEELNSIFYSISSMKEHLNTISRGVNELNQSSLNIQKSVANVEENAELQNDYLNMIESNTKAAAYISAATYLRAFH